MTIAHKKFLEIDYAKKAGELLGETWNVEPSPDEVRWPDVIVRTGTVAFGLEVREIYLDESIKGSKDKAKEGKNLKEIRKLADDYYRENNPSIRVNLLGDVSRYYQILNTIITEVQQLTEHEEKRIVPYSGCIAYVRRLPYRYGKYKRWDLYLPKS
ncbi:MAG: hypothetical protein FJ264_01050 [Planctomycetes bacterium]|nr:hypothetical protein [Planctomycetota bacterium]